MNNYEMKQSEDDDQCRKQTNQLVISFSIEVITRSAVVAG